MAEKWSCTAKPTAISDYEHCTPTLQNADARRDHVVLFFSSDDTTRMLCTRPINLPSSPSGRYKGPNWREVRSEGRHCGAFLLGI